MSQTAADDRYYAVMRLTAAGAADNRFQGDGNQIYDVDSQEPLSPDSDGATAFVRGLDGRLFLGGTIPAGDGSANTAIVIALESGLPFGDGFESGGSHVWKVAP